MKKSKFTINFLFNLLYEIVIVLTPLLITPYVSRVLGAENIGIKSYTYSIAAIFYSFGELGVTVYGQKKIAECEDNLEKRSKAFFEIFIMKFVLTFINMIAYFFIFCVFKADKVFYSYFVLWLPLLFEGMISLKWYFQGIGEFKALSIFYTLGKILFIISVYIFVKSVNDLKIYILINASFQAIIDLFMIGYVLKTIKFSCLKNLCFRNHLVGAFVYFIPALSMTLYSTLDRAMLRVITNDLISVGYYEQSQKIVVLFNSLFLALFSILRTYFINLKNEYSDNKDIYIKEIYSKFHYVILMVIPIVLGICVVIDDFVLLFFGEDYSICSKIILMFLPIIFVQSIGGFFQASYIIPNNKQNILNYWNIISVIVNALLNLLLIDFFGIYGAIFASIISELINFSAIIYISRYVVNFKNIFMCSWKKIISGLVMFSITFILKNYIVFSPYLNLIIIVLVACLSYFVFLLLLRDELIIGIYNGIYKKIRHK